MNKSILAGLFVFGGLSSAALAAPGFFLDPLTTFGGGDGYVGAGERTYLTTGSTERGMAYNPLTNNVYVVSRTGTSGAPRVGILNGDTGAEASVVDLTGLAGGLFLANTIRVGDDGAIYVANLTTTSSATNPFKVYRYANEAALLANTFTTAFSGELTTGNRYGDDINIRGGGANTQIVIGGGTNSDDLVIFNTSDGSNFNANVFNVAPANGDLRSGVAFGPGNTVYAKEAGDGLRLISFDLTSPSATVTQTYTTAQFPSAVGPIEVDALNTLLAGLFVGTPDSTRLYDISDTSVTPPQLDLDAFGQDNANVNVAGAADFGTFGGIDRLYVLNSTNGIQAFVVMVPEPASLGLLALAGAALLGRRHS